MLMRNKPLDFDHFLAFLTFGPNFKLFSGTAVKKEKKQLREGSKN